MKHHAYMLCGLVLKWLNLPETKIMAMRIFGASSNHIFIYDMFCTPFSITAIIVLLDPLIMNVILYMAGNTFLLQNWNIVLCSNQDRVKLESGSAWSEDFKMGGFYFSSLFYPIKH